MLSAHSFVLRLRSRLSFPLFLSGTIAGVVIGIVGGIVIKKSEKILNQIKK